MSFLRTTNRQDLVDYFSSGLQDLLTYDVPYEISDLSNQLDTYKMSMRLRAAALKKATQYGDLSKVKEILQVDGGIFTKDRGWIVKVAANAGRIDIMQELLDDKEQISEEQLGWAVIDAVDGEHIDAVEYLLEQGSISQIARGEALNIAVHHGKIRIVQALLEDGAKIPKSYRAKAQEVAMRKREGGILLELLKDKGEMSTEYRDLAFKVAIESNHIAVALAFLQQGSIFSTSSIGLLVRVATRKKRLNILQALLGHKPNISISDREKALAIAMDSNQELFVQELTKGHMALAVKLAVKKGDLIAVKKFLKEEQPISPKDRGQAIALAAEYGYLPIIRALLKNDATVSQFDRTIALEIARIKRSPDIVSYLSESPPPFKVSTSNNPIRRSPSTITADLF